MLAVGIEIMWVKETTAKGRGRGGRPPIHDFNGLYDYLDDEVRKHKLFADDEQIIEAALNWFPAPKPERDYVVKKIKPLKHRWVRPN